MLSAQSTTTDYIRAGLHQGWTQTSFYFQVIHFTSHHTTSHVFEPIYIPRALDMGTCIQQGDLFYSVGLHKNRCWPQPTQEKIRRGFGKKYRWIDQKGRNKQGRNAWQWVYHVWLYTDLLQAIKGECLSSVFSPDGTLISASTAPQCRDKGIRRKLQGDLLPVPGSEVS